MDTYQEHAMPSCEMAIAYSLAPDAGTRTVFQEKPTLKSGQWKRRRRSSNKMSDDIKNRCKAAAAQKDKQAEDAVCYQDLIDKLCEHGVCVDNADTNSGVVLLCVDGARKKPLDYGVLRYCGERNWCTWKCGSKDGSTSKKNCKVCRLQTISESSNDNDSSKDNTIHSVDKDSFMKCPVMNQIHVSLAKDQIPAECPVIKDQIPAECPLIKDQIPAECPVIKSLQDSYEMITCTDLETGEAQACIRSKHNNDKLREKKLNGLKRLWKQFHALCEHASSGNKSSVEALISVGPGAAATDIPVFQ